MNNFDLDHLCTDHRKLGRIPDAKRLAVRILNDGLLLDELADRATISGFYRYWEVL